MNPDRSYPALGRIRARKRYRGTFPADSINGGENLLLELRPSRTLLYKGHPLLGLLMFPGTFTIPFMFLVPLLAFFGVLGWILRHWYEVGAALLFAVIALVYGSGALSWFRTRYALTDRAVYVKSGSFITGIERIPYGNVTDITVSRSLLERISGRGTMIFHTDERGSLFMKKARWHTISHPDEVCMSLRDVILHRRGRPPEGGSMI